MLEIAICDDEERVLPELKKQIQDILDKQTIHNQPMEADFHLYTSCEQFLEEYEERQIDCLFLDIDMPKMNGFELAKILKEKEAKTLLVFVTNQDALVYESFSFQPFAFIRKAYFQQEIEAVMIRMLAEYKKSPKVYTIHNGNEVVRVDLETMMYFEAQGNYVRLVTTDGEYRMRETLGNLTEQLEAAGFIRIHKGFLVNQLCILAIRQNEIELNNHELLPIGRTNKDSVRSKLMSYLR